MLTVLDRDWAILEYPIYVWGRGLDSRGATRPRPWGPVGGRAGGVLVGGMAS
jgi:hypothetical protein